MLQEYKADYEREINELAAEHEKVKEKLLKFEDKKAKRSADKKSKREKREKTAHFTNINEGLTPPL